MSNRDCDIAKEKPASGVGETQPALSLDFDPVKYRYHIDDQNLTEEQAAELLGALWEIMKAFVDLGFGVNSIHNFIPALGSNTPDTGGNGVELEDHKHTQRTENSAHVRAGKDEDS